MKTCNKCGKKDLSWSKMNTPLEIQSNNSKKRGEPAPKPNAVQAAGSAPTETQPLTHMVEGKQVEKPKTSKYTRGYQRPKDETQQATSSPPVEPHEDTSSSVDKIPIPQKGAGKIVELHGGKGTGTSQAQGKGLSTMVTQEGGSTHVGMEPKVPSSGKKGKGSSLERGKILEAKKNPITPKGYKQPSKKETKDIKTGKDPKGLRGEKGSKYTSQRLASIKSNSIITKMNIIKLDLMEIKKRKDMGDTAKDPDTEGLSHKEVSTNEVTGQQTVRPTHVQGGGYTGKGRRRKINGKKVIVPQTADETVPKQGQVPTSTKGDKHMSQGLNNASTGEIKESFDMITNNEAFQEAIHRNAPLTQEEGTEKFDNADATTNKIRARIAAREARKRKKGKKVNRAISEINSMTDGMRELIKETEVQRIKKIPANTEEEEQQKRFALSDAQRSDRMAKPDTSLLHNNKPYVPFSDRKNKDL